MKKLVTTAFLLLATAGFASAVEFDKDFKSTPNDNVLQLQIEGVNEGQPIPDKFANCVATKNSKSAKGLNTSPQLSWKPGPEGTKSYAIIMVDRDEPVNIDEANKDGANIAQDVPRKNFYHWMLVNIPPNITSLNEGEGKKKISGATQLVNDNMKFRNLPKNPQNFQVYSGYDGPCPPWNDELVHHYHFKVLALSDRLMVPEEYTGDALVKGIVPLTLSTGSVMGTYTLNPALK